MKLTTHISSPLTWLLLLASGTDSAAAKSASPVAFDSHNQVTYRGLERNGIEVFLNIPFGEDTSGAHRFKPPRPHVPEPNSTVDAREYGPACPQALGSGYLPGLSTKITDVSEDCLNLNVARPRGLNSTSRLPVLVWIFGGSFLNGQNREITTQPDNLILEAVENGTPVLHVAMNYRLGVFGFAQSGALKSEGSENAGLRDQRLAIEWVRDNIAYFGGDPEKITIFGQSSGGLSVGIQMLAYGASKPVPFQQGICESQALEPGITGNFSRDATRRTFDYVGCKKSDDLDSAETLACIRDLDTDTVLYASLSTYKSGIEQNVGDIWLPSVDGDFLPAAPSELIRTGRFANVTALIGYCDDDVALMTDRKIAAPDDTHNFIQSYVPALNRSNVKALLELYPSDEFIPNGNERDLSAEFYRASRIFRDILMTCQPVFYARHLAARGNDVHLYDWNQTVLGPYMQASGLGTFHGSDLPYVYGALDFYDASKYPFHPTREDYVLDRRAPRSWATFATTGRPGANGTDTFQGFDPAFAQDQFGQGDGFSVFVVGGPTEGFSAVDGPLAAPAVKAQRLRERCAFLNSDEVIEQLRY